MSYVKASPATLVSVEPISECILKEISFDGREIYE